MPGQSVVTILTQKRAVFPAFSSRGVTSGQMRKIGIHFIIYLGKCRPIPEVIGVTFLSPAPVPKKVTPAPAP